MARCVSSIPIEQSSHFPLKDSLIALDHLERRSIIGALPSDSLKKFTLPLYGGETNGLDIIAAQDCSFSAPLPRSWGFLDGSAFIQHVKLARKARGADLPAELESVPLMYQGVSDNLLGPHDDIPLRDITDGLDFESEIGVIVDSVPRGTTAKEAGKHIQLVLLLNDISLRSIIPREVGTGFGFIQSKPPSAFAPFAVTPDELGAAWKDGRLHLPVKTTLNGEIIGSPNAGEMFFSFNQLIEHAVATRSLSAGTIIGSGTVSNEDSHVGSGCLAERRMLEQIASGSVTTPWLTEGDTVSISVHQDGVDLFGTINQTVRKI